MSKKIKHNCRNCEHSVFDPTENSPAKYRCYNLPDKRMYTQHSPKDSCPEWKENKEE